MTSKPSSSSKPPKYSVPSVDGACRILQLVCGSDQAVAFTRLHRETDLTRTTALRIVASLCEHRFLQRREDGLIEPGSALALLARRVFGAGELRARAAAVLRDLAEQTRETAHLALPAGEQVLIAEVVDSPELLRVASRPGSLVDYHCSSTGKVLLAFDELLSDALRKRNVFTRRTPRTIITWKALEKHLQQVRRAGYAVDDEEYHPGVRCIAAPVYDATGKLIAAIGITGSKERVERPKIAALALQVRAAAGRLA